MREKATGCVTANYVCNFFFLVLAHRAKAALRALALRSSGVSLAARALPPFEPPILPKATA